MSDLQERLQELAEAAARQGRTPGPQAALRRGRRRRLRLAAGTAALLALVLLAGLLGSVRLASQPAPLAPPATTGPPAITPGTTAPSRELPPSSAPDVSISPDPGEVLKPAGSPPGEVGAGMVRDVASELTRCRGGDPDGPKVLVAWGEAHGQTWLIIAKPPRAGEDWLCWGTGLFDAGGAGGLGNSGGPTIPVKPLQASGAQNIRSGGQYWGQIIGAVTKDAARVQVLFRSGIAPLELSPIQADDRFPVNFFVGFYRQPNEDKNLEWFVTRVIAYDQAGRNVAECQATAGPGHSC
jgi:hypothetical protein